MELSQNPQVKGYLDAVCAEIKWQEVHSQVKQELLSHIAETAEEYLQSGLKEEAAIDKALEQMGDALSIGKQLHQVHKPRLEWSLLLLVGSFLALGLFMLYTLDINGMLAHRTGASLFKNNLFFASIGLLLVGGITLANYRQVKKFSWHIFVGTLLIILIVFHTNVERSPYYGLGFTSLNFLYTFPYFLAMALAGIFFEWDWNQPKWLVKALVLLAIPNIFALQSNSLSPALIYTTVFLVLMMASGAKLHQIFLAAIFPLLLFIWSLLMAPYRWERFIAFLNPYANPLGEGFMQVKSLEAIRSAGFWGQGFTLPFGTLPEIQEALIFSYIVYSFGWIAGIAVLALGTTLIFRMARAAKQVKDRYGSLLITGLVSIFAVQFYWNIFMTLSLLPITRFSLPFISYSGAELIVQLAALGLVFSIYRRKDLAASSL